MAICPRCARSATYFDNKPNEGLRKDMIDYARSVQLRYTGHRFYTDLERFVTEVNAAAENKPYAWIAQTLNFVDEQLLIYPPTGDSSLNDDDKKSAMIRRHLLVIKDYPMHSEKGQADFVSAYTTHYLQAMRKLLAWLDTPAPAQGKMEVFKFINMGVVARTANHCVAFDIWWPGTNSQAVQFSSKIDALFTTHAHGDHYDHSILAALSDRPEAFMFMDSTLPEMTGFEDKKKATQYMWSEDQTEATDAGGIKVRAMMGAQAPIPCLLYCVELDGFCIWTAGDNNDHEAAARMTRFTAPDIVCMNVASPWDISQKAREAVGADKTESYYLLTHENEINHDPDGRPGYKFFLEHKDYGVTNPNRQKQIHSFLALNVGEHITLSK